MWSELAPAAETRGKGRSRDPLGSNPQPKGSRSLLGTRTHGITDLNIGVQMLSLTTLRFPLVSLRASRNSPARLGSMLSCRRRASLPAPGRHKGRIPEWDTETRTDMRTVVQQAVSGGPLHTAFWEDEAEIGAGGAQPPELRAMAQTAERAWVVLDSSDVWVYDVCRSSKAEHLFKGRLCPRPASSSMSA